MRPESLERKPIPEKTKELSNSRVQLEKSIDELKNIKGKSSKEWRSSMSSFFSSLKEEFEDAGGQYYSDVEEFYEDIKKNRKQLIARRHNPEDIIEKKLDGKPLNVVCDKKTTNCVVWDPEEGAKAPLDAFAKGMSHLGGVATVVGFEEGKFLKIVKSKTTGYSDNENLERKVEGYVPLKNTPVIFRFPIRYFPEDKMTDEEQDRLDDVISGEEKIKIHIFRAFDFKK